MQEAMRRFPGIAGDDSWSVVLEKNAGYLMVERCVEAHLRQAEVPEQRSSLIPRSSICSRDSVASRFERTDTRTSPRKWSSRAALGHRVGFIRRMLPLKVMRKHIYWYSAPIATYGQEQGFPCYFYETPDGYFYGTPMRNDFGIKVARHSGGERCKQSKMTFTGTIRTISARLSRFWPRLCRKSRANCGIGPDATTP